MWLRWQQGEGAIEVGCAKISRGGIAPERDDRVRVVARVPREGFGLRLAGPAQFS